jgi:hypothetical protein
MRRPNEAQRLDDLESDFRPLLTSCLLECQNGRWGLFGQNDGADEDKYLDWREGQNLREIAQQIRDFRAGFGQPNTLVERFLPYYSLRGPNVPGQPKLAGALLDEIQRDDFDAA